MPPFSEAEARAAIAQAVTWSDALRFLGYSVKGCNYRTLQRWVGRWNISTVHFDPYAGQRRSAAARTTPLDRVLVENSSYPRQSLKRRLLALGIKKAVCEMCGQGEIWKGRRMALVLDHINGIANDHRLRNLRMVCPNCAATLDTHCGRNVPRERLCPRCGRSFVPQKIQHRYCSQQCWGAVAAERYRGLPHPETRRVERPSYQELMANLESMSFVALGRKYGVSDNAIRKWIRWYEHQAERERAGRPPAAQGAADEDASNERRAA